MGIYDRDYYRRSVGEHPSIWPQTAVGTIIFICVALYLIDWIFFGEDHRLTWTLAATDAALLAPWLWWKFLTYGFVHDPAPSHIVLNMLQLFFLGREIEDRYGRAEFWCVYLTMIVLGGIVHALVNIGTPFALVGASGAVSGVVLLFVLNNPQARLMPFLIPIAIPAWVIGIALVVLNIWGALGEVGLIEGGEGPRIAFVVHLVGLAFAFVYFRLGWNISRMWSGLVRIISQWKSRPRLRIVDNSDQPEEDLDEEIDRILEKISRYGEASLTRRERKILLTAAQRYRHRLEKEGRKTD